VDEVKTAPKTAAKVVRKAAEVAAGAVAGAVDAAATVVGVASGSMPAGNDALPLPDSRAQLLELHAAARRRRDAAPPQSHERAAASFELERIEIQVARIERAMDPPLV
jgi:hypothetical protein